MMRESCSTNSIKPEFLKVKYSSGLSMKIVQYLHAMPMHFPMESLRSILSSS